MNLIRAVGGVGGFASALRETDLKCFPNWFRSGSYRGPERTICDGFSVTKYYVYYCIQNVTYFIRSRLFRHLDRQLVLFSKFCRHNVILRAFFHERLMSFVHNFLFDHRENLRKLCLFIEITF